MLKEKLSFKENQVVELDNGWSCERYIIAMNV